MQRSNYWFNGNFFDQYSYKIVFIKKICGIESSMNMIT